MRRDEELARPDDEKRSEGVGPFGSSALASALAAISAFDVQHYLLHPVMHGCCGS
ncbi:hypothetical protein [Streptomyces sp. 2131.1]|uniref:hypothetical protein n=1 Tax=Streptomyces sp. 2131.1 TaxID=1855346 RepID=UPI0015A2FCEE|nr:hypothetical protein [Streptomyces sp. 2131.1]